MSSLLRVSVFLQIIFATEKHLAKGLASEGFRISRDEECQKYAASTRKLTSMDE